MSGWAKGFLAGVLVVGAVVTLAGGKTTFEGFARVGAAGGLVLDLREDESTIGRATNAPGGVLGEVRAVKRAWFFLTTYALTLQIRPEVAPGPGQAVAGMSVQASLPGIPIATNAARVTARGAVWERLPAGGIQLATRAVHWGRILITILGLAAVLIAGRRF